MRLREEGTSYQEVLDATRRDLAIRYLTQTTLRADEIANVLAYLDANSVLRGFRRWTGLSPLAFRQANNQSSVSGENPDRPVFVFTGAVSRQSSGHLDKNPDSKRRNSQKAGYPDQSAHDRNAEVEDRHIDQT